MGWFNHQLGLLLVLSWPNPKDWFGLWWSLSRLAGTIGLRLGGLYDRNVAGFWVVKTYVVDGSETPQTNQRFGCFWNPANSVGYLPKKNWWAGFLNPINRTFMMCWVCMCIDMVVSTYEYEWGCSLLHAVADVWVHIYTYLTILQPQRLNLLYMFIIVYIYIYVPYIYNKHSNPQQAFLGDESKQTFQSKYTIQG